MASKPNLRWSRACPILAGFSLVLIAAGVIIYQILWTSSEGSETVAPDRTATESQSRAQGQRVIIESGMFIDQASARSLEGLFKDSDMVVIGKITSSELVSRPQFVDVAYPCGTPRSDGQVHPCKYSGEFGWYLTNYGVQVERYLKGGETGVSDLTVQEMGGVADGVEIVVKDWPRYEQAKRYLMFLKWDSQKPGIAYTSAAALGGYPLEGGQVQRFPDAVGYHGGAPEALDALTESGAISRIDSLVRDTASAE